MAEETDTATVADVPEGLYTVGEVARASSSLSALRAESYSQYAHDGFLAVARGLSPEETQRAIDGLTTLILREDSSGYQLQFEGGRESGRMLTGDARVDAVRKLMMFVDQDPRLSATAANPSILAVVERLLGGRPKLIQDMALIKPPGGGREKPWHQDLAYFNYPVSTRVVGVWIALDAATVDNGCMHVFPGSHRAGPAPHFMIRDWQLCDGDVLGLRCTAVPLPAGGVLFFDGLLHHGTPPNLSGTRRRALQFHYVAEEATGIPSEDRLKLFGSEGKNATC